MKLFILVFFVLYSANILIGQNFTILPLITIPGNNYDYDILSPQIAQSYVPTYICWINEIASVYTVYLKEISPNDGEIVIISQDSTKKSNPQVSINRYNQGIKIAWQNYSKDHWQILGRNYQNDTLSGEDIIADSLENDPQITMNVHRIAWNEDGKILIKEFYPELSETFIVDSTGCSSPNLANEDGLTISQILYEKGPTGSKQIFFGELNKSLSKDWNLSQISHGYNSINPRFGINNEIAFQSYYNDVWKIIYTKLVPESMDTTDNRNFNYKNPIVFTYPIPISSTHQSTPFFLVFDSNSTDENINTVYVKTFGYVHEDNKISISNISGNNYKPNYAYLNYVDSSLISIIWIREYNDKKDIWIATDKFVPIGYGIDEKSSSLLRFSLKQNYPNPFNPITTIEYQVPVASYISIAIFNQLGQKIAILVNKRQLAGNYKITWDASNYPSSIYFYRLKTNKKFVQTKKLVLLK